MLRLFQHINPDMWERTEAEESRSSHDPCIPPSSINTVRRRHSHPNLLTPTSKLPSLGKLVLLHLSAGSSLPPLPSVPPPLPFCLSSLFRVAFLPYSPFIRERQRVRDIPQMSVLYPPCPCIFLRATLLAFLPVFHILPSFPSHQRVMCALRCFSTQGRSASPRPGCTYHCCTHGTCAFNMFPCSFKIHLTVPRSSTFGSVGPMQGWIQAMTDCNPCSFVVWQKQEVNTPRALLLIKITIRLEEVMGFLPNKKVLSHLQNWIWRSGHHCGRLMLHLWHVGTHFNFIKKKNKLAAPVIWILHLATLPVQQCYDEWFSPCLPCFREMWGNMRSTWEEHLRHS